MNQIIITKRYVDSRFPNLPFEVDEKYDALLPNGSFSGFAPVQRVVSAPNKNVESANLVTINVPKENWKVFSGKPYYVTMEMGNNNEETAIQPTKSDKSIKYIFLGIVVIGFVSFLVMSKGKKIKK